MLLIKITRSIIYRYINYDDARGDEGGEHVWSIFADICASIDAKLYISSTLFNCVLENIRFGDVWKIKDWDKRIVLQKQSIPFIHAIP